MNTAATESTVVDIVRLGPSRLSELMEVQKVVCEHLPNPELYFPVSEREMLELLGSDAICVGAQQGTRLVGFFGVLFMGNRAGNVGEDLGLAPHELSLVAYFKAVNVLPEYRGIGLQARMTKALFMQLGVGGQVSDESPGLPPLKWLCSTVSPLNVPSLKTFLEHGFWVAGLKPKYLGYQRCILIRQIADTQHGHNESVVASLQDYQEQKELLRSGMIGCQLVCDSDTPTIHYIQGDR